MYGLSSITNLIFTVQASSGYAIVYVRKGDDSMPVNGTKLNVSIVVKW